MRRQKRNPDSIQLNFVESLPKRKSVQIRRVSYSLSCAAQPCASTPAPTPAASLNSTASIADTSADSNSGHDPLPDDVQDLLSGDSLFSPRMRESHRERKARAAEAWAEIRPKLIPAMISSIGFPSGVACIVCKCSTNVWCKDCGALTYMCEKSTRETHAGINLFLSNAVEG